MSGETLTDGGNTLTFGPDTLFNGPDGGSGDGGGTLAMSLDNLIQVTIDARTRSVSQKGFGTPLLLGSHNKYPDIVRNYDASSCISSMESDGFEADHPLVLLASAALQQNPSPVNVKIGKMSAAVAATIELIPNNFVQGTVYKFDVCAKPGGVVSTISHTVGAGSSLAVVLTALQVQLAAAAGTTLVTSTNASTKIALTQASGKLIQVNNFACVPDRRVLEVRDVTPAPASGYGSALTAIAAVDGDFYGVASDVNSKAVVLEIAALVETMKRIYATSDVNPDSANVGIATDQFSALAAAAYTRTFTTIKQDSTLPFFGGGVLGSLLPRNPGEYTMAYKTIAGQTVDNGFSLETAIQNKKGNWYEAVGGANILFPGQMSSGQFIDITVFVDFLCARIQEAVYLMLINNPKIPFTASGIDTVRIAIKNILNANTESAKNPMGGLAADPAPFVVVPAVSAIAPNDKAARILRAVRFQAVLSGAIHTTILQGTVTL